IFDGIDWNRAEGIQTATKILEDVTLRGREAAEVVKVELAEALSKLSVETLAGLKKQIEDTFGTGTEEAKKMAAAVNAATFAKLGVDREAIKSGFTSTGKAAIDAFRLAVSEIDSMGLTAEQKAFAIARAFDSAFKQAS